MAAEAKEAITTMEGALKYAVKTMDDFFDPAIDNDKRIPVDLMQGAKGLAFLTVIKAGFIWTGKVGTGLVLARLPDGRWSAPSAIGTIGMGVGFEAGGQIINYMIILNSEAAVKSFMQKGQLSAGANIEFAAGPFGRAAGANANISAQGIAPNYTYSHSKGLFGGAGLQGSAIAARSDINKTFYGREISPAEILMGGVDQPAAAAPLYEVIDRVLALPSQGNPLSKLPSMPAMPSMAGVPSAIRAKLHMREPMPSAVQGSEVQVVYQRVLASIESIAGLEFVADFKVKCKEFGQSKMEDSAFITFMAQAFNAQQRVTLYPDVVRLLQDKHKRQVLWSAYLDAKDEVAATTPATTATAPSLF
ncbi:hypothetical protein SPRG_12410 [Saprolegnia parasitica CBS 223.65]|uniref:Uncharacterized protein n=1 Tax=Saprolegnia parasitica (strain CBS 223.65) TaxID=695850 RepID=A0A067BT15_SAPPC|nr:hypothetical protein SPRG_12410 [Saprolegnia parasitica CBS 223.65]KDO21403.1 hypothetical protein SPRG_12410 [Saprolegnia parasitica CBS 223.65]|eukprot:XP_012207850.1 hypothetical protein SPRG_12410 [Saprolegnia parasitica CBS 223.65]